jgi:Na+/H+-dicarboxylate symporter
MTLGLAWGLFSLWIKLDVNITLFYIKPFGDIFTASLKMVAVPLIIASLITGIGGLKDVSRLSILGKKTIALYLFTTIIAICVGLGFANFIKPGNNLSIKNKEMLIHSFAQQANNAKDEAHESFNEGILSPMVQMVPENIFEAMSNNKSMIQVVLFVLFFAICLVLIEDQLAKPVISFFEGVNAVVLKMIDIIMICAPIGVFGLVAGVVVMLPNIEILIALLKYCICVILGLSTILLVVYPSLLYFTTKKNIIDFYKEIRPAQLLAFSTSSSSATLPLSMEVAQDKLNIKPEISSFVLPLGSTINMDGTSLYQAVATIFIAEVFGIDLSLMAQLSIVLLALVTSVGAAGVPGAGMILLAVILEANHIPVEGIALILAVDRILDMCRSSVNVTGDLVVASIVNHQNKE